MFFGLYKDSTRIADLKIVVSLCLNTSAMRRQYLISTGPAPYTGGRSFFSTAVKVSTILVLRKKVKRPTDMCRPFFGGAYETRTRHLLTASQTL